MWVCLFLNVTAWPHLAYYVAKHSKTPYSAEVRNLNADSIFCGMWIGAIGLNPISSVAMSCMVIMNGIATGGGKAFRTGIALQLAGLTVWYVLFGITFKHSTLNTAWASMPLLTIYPMTVGWASYKLSSELYKIKNTLNALSITDGLTGLINRRHLDQTLTAIAKDSAYRYQTFLAVIDIDHFKEINDKYGHQVGDSVLRLLSRILKSSMRSSDLIGRFGGDEFCVVTINSTPEQTASILNRVRLNFQHESTVLLGEPRSISVGVAGWRNELESATQWFARADALLYRAKKNGRNMIEIEAEQTSNREMAD